MMIDKQSYLKKGGLYAITSPQCDSKLLYQKVDLALKSGVGLLQYRDKWNNKRRRLQEASQLKKMCDFYQIPLLINDDFELALKVGANGVHLGQDDADIRQARSYLGDGAIIGVSCYAQVSLAIDACLQGADYVAFGRFYASDTKPLASAAPLSVLSAAQQQISCPMVAIGGILPRHIVTLKARGVDWYAVVSGIFSYDKTDISRATAAYMQRL